MTVEAAKALVSGEVATTAPFAQFLRSWVAESDNDFEWAADMARLCRAQHKALEKKRLSFTAPLNGVVREINDFFRAPLGQLEESWRLLDAQIAAFRASREAVRVKAMLATSPVPPPAEAPGVAVREVLDFEITDASIVPRRYCSPDLAVIRDAVRVAGDVIDIPGVRIFRKSVVTVRQK